MPGWNNQIYERNQRHADYYQRLRTRLPQPPAAQHHLEKFTFGKHAQKTLWDILICDPGYIAWASENLEIRQPRLAEALAWMATTYQDICESAQKFRRA
jgi:uncharacterized damage-inducible protein DinB